MVYTRKQRILATLIIAALAASLGAGAGYLVGRVLALRVAYTQLDQYAMSIQTAGSAANDDAYKILAVINNSPYPSCSAAEIGYLRTLVFQSEYVKEIGRMREGRIICSAMLGRVAQPSVQYQPDFIQKDGARVYLNLGPFRIENLWTMSLQLGNSYIVFRPQLQRHFVRPFMRYTITKLDKEFRKSGELSRTFPGVPDALLIKQGRAHLGDSLFVTDCFDQDATCVTTGIKVSDALISGRYGLVQIVACGGLIGAFLGAFCSIVYRRNQSLSVQLRRAIRADKLRVVYQPIVELEGRRVVGAEALVRWTDEDGYSQAPSMFVKIAEERGFVGEITRLVVRHALRDFSETLRCFPDFLLSIDVTASDLVDPKFLPMLDLSLAHNRTAARNLVIEITEGATVRNEAAMHTIRQLHQRGYSIHLDDFGTGYSSLAYLHELSVDAIKIDKAFTRAIGTEAVTKTILPQILAMAESLDLKAVVVGVETEEQARYFTGMDRPILAQGRLFGHPVSADEFHRLLTEEAIPAGIDMNAG